MKFGKREKNNELSEPSTTVGDRRSLGNGKNFGECFFGSDAKFEGVLRTSGFVRIEGDFSGSIIAGASVVVGEASRVEADVSAESVIISGRMKGKIQATREVQILPTAKVMADIVASSLIVEKGGLVYGNFTRA
jgi:cytoskeletal protein CcmA (bactofilin family)